MRADRKEGRIELPVFHAVDGAVDFAVEFEGDTKVGDAFDLGIEDVARQPIFRNAEAHHAAGEGAGLVDFNGVAPASQMISGGKPGRAGAHDQYAFARFGLRRRERPAVTDRGVAKEALDRIDADRFVDLRAVASAFTRVIANTAHHGWSRIFL